MIEEIKKHWILTLIGILLILASIIFPFIVYFKEGQIAAFGQLGDSFNILATFIQIITVIFLGMTLNEQRKAFKAQNDGMNEQKAMIAEQQAIMVKQYQAMNQQQENLKNQLIEMNKSNKIEAIGILLKKIDDDIRNIKYQSESGHTESYDAINHMAIDLTNFHHQNNSAINTICARIIVKIEPIVNSFITACRFSGNDELLRNLVKSQLPAHFLIVVKNSIGKGATKSSAFVSNEAVNMVFQSKVRQLPVWLVKEQFGFLDYDADYLAADPPQDS